MGRNQRLNTLEELILDLLKNCPKQTIHKNGLEELLRLGSKREFKRFEKAINSLCTKGLIQMSGNSLSQNKLRDKKSAVRKNSREIKNYRGLLKGRIQITPRGMGFVIVDELDDDVRISRRDVATALNGDLVEILIQGVNKKTGQPQGKIVDIIKRGKDFYVGTFKRTGVKTFLIEPDLKSAHVDFFVQPENVNGAETNDKVTFELRKWVHPKALPEAVITSILGKTGSNDANILSILAENELKSGFPQEVEVYADKIPLEIPQSEIEKRLDLREETIFTIDPHDAKDFDDALSINHLENGNYYLGANLVFRLLLTRSK